MAKAKKQEVIKSIDDMFKKYADSAVKRGDAKEKGKSEVRRWNSPLISDYRYMGGGPVKGKVTAYSGLFSCGKTSRALQIAGHNKDAKVLFLDAEFEWEDYSYDWVENFFGLEEGRIKVLQPEFIEEAAAFVYDACGIFDIVIYDGFSSIGSRFEFEATVDSQTMAEASKVYNRFWKKVKGRLSKTDTTLLVTNKLYENVGPKAVFKPIIEPGGKGIGFYPSQKQWLTMGNMKDGDKKVIGQEVRVEVKKDKVSGNRGAKYGMPYYNETGFDVVEDLVNNAVDFGIIEKSGSWYSYNGTKIGQGSDKVKTMLSDNPELYKEIFDKCISYIDDNKEQFSNMEETINNDTD